MRRGFSVLLFFIAVVGVSFVFLFRPGDEFNKTPYLKQRSRAEMALLEMAIEEFRNDYGAAPTGTSAQIVQVLCGNNLRKKTYLTAVVSNHTNGRGEFFDPWGTPYEISVILTNDFYIRSAGPNKKFGDSDDIRND